MSEILEVPNSWRAGVITSDGLGLLSKLVKGHSLQITRAETGAGFVDPELLAQQTAVTEPMQALSFNAISYPEAGKCLIPCKLDNAEVTESYIARQIGLYANDPDKGEILYYITQVEDEAGGTGIPSVNLIPSYSSTWNIVIYYGMADGVNITVDPAGLVSEERMNAAIDSAMANFANEVGDAIIRPITIPVSDWVAVGEGAEDLEGYLYTIDVDMAVSMDNHFPILAYDIPSLGVASEAGVCPTIDALDGFVRLWSKAVPAVDLTGTILLRSENVVELGTATDEEVNDAVDDVFGEGSSDESGGSGDSDGRDIATNEDVENMLNDVF